MSRNNHLRYVKVLFNLCLKFKLFLQVFFLKCFFDVLIFDGVFFSVVLKVSLRDTKGDAYARKADEGQVASTEEINSSTTDQHIKWLLFFCCLCCCCRFVVIPLELKVGC